MHQQYTGSSNRCSAIKLLLCDGVRFHEQALKVKIRDLKTSELNVSLSLFLALHLQPFCTELILQLCKRVY